MFIPYQCSFIFGEDQKSTRGRRILPLVHVKQPSEYHLQGGSESIGYNDMSQDLTGEGVFKAWFPQGVAMTETQVCIERLPRLRFSS